MFIRIWIVDLAQRLVIASVPGFLRKRGSGTTMFPLSPGKFLIPV